MPISQASTEQACKPALTKEVNTSPIRSVPASPSRAAGPALASSSPTAFSNSFASSSAALASCSILRNTFFRSVAERGLAPGVLFILCSCRCCCCCCCWLPARELLRGEGCGVERFCRLGLLVGPDPPPCEVKYDPGDARPELLPSAIDSEGLLGKVWDDADHGPLRDAIDWIESRRGSAEEKKLFRLVDTSLTAPGEVAAATPTSAVECELVGRGRAAPPPPPPKNASRTSARSFAYDRSVVAISRMRCARFDKPDGVDVPDAPAEGNVEDVGERMNGAGIKPDGSVPDRGFCIGVVTPAAAPGGSRAAEAGGVPCPRLAMGMDGDLIGVACAKTAADEDDVLGDRTEGVWWPLTASVEMMDVVNESAFCVTADEGVSTRV